ncbi:glycosyl transferase [Mesorhizobium sp. L-8-10]|uniref:glycosyltransferase n=1 Tax=Mesorhizobium sp. L-8-10 TaxID=2744523 RepID=UPI0019273936|nr:glycosyltransferase family 4 protein [Mesorhizobium sp. L-8-10]BCH34653.1 glycosyl transferase [Mesorhizobium sp. L-8-10]
MHLVFATSIVPDGAPSTGYEIANAAIIGALRRVGVRVTVLGFIWPGRQPADPQDTVVLGAVDVRTDTASVPRKLAWLAGAMRSGLTFSSVKLRVVSHEAVRAALKGIGPVDGYILNSVQFAAAFEGVFDDRPSIFVAHNVEHRSAEENAAASGSLFQRLLFSREARLLKEIEDRLCRRARFVLTLAEEDRAALGVADASKSAFLPLVTRDRLPPPPAPRAIDCDAALIGTWTWQPNRIGLDWFLNEVVPHLNPDFRIRIAGSIGGNVSSPHPGVSFVGRVPDATEFVRSGAVVPLISTAGSGVQLKTIETFELGLPSVATSRSLRGIDRPPANCVVADEPEAFARALEEAVSLPLRDLDGRGFFESRREALDHQIALGLQALDPAAPKVPA